MPRRRHSTSRKRSLPAQYLRHFKTITNSSESQPIRTTSLFALGHAKPPPETCQYSSMLQCRISAAAFNYFSCTRKLSFNHTLIIRVHFIETTPFTSPYYPSPQRLVNLFDPDSTFFFLPKKNIRSRWCHWRDAVNAESGR